MPYKDDDVKNVARAIEKAYGTYSTDVEQDVASKSIAVHCHL